MKKELIAFIAISLLVAGNANAQGSQYGFGGTYGGYGNYGSSSQDTTQKPQYQNQGQGKNQAQSQNQGQGQEQATNNAKTAMQEIILSYDGFDLRKNPTGRVTCGVTFHLENNTPFRLLSFGAGLNWSVMKTTINFDDVNPGDKAVLKYRLLGQGCYTMTGAPEIVINRCRMRAVQPKKEGETKIVSQEEDEEDEDSQEYKLGLKGESQTTPLSVTQDQCADFVRWR